MYFTQHKKQIIHHINTVLKSKVKLKMESEAQKSLYQSVKLQVTNEQPEKTHHRYKYM